jgi:PAS domain S-box-containing protein
MKGGRDISADAQELYRKAEDKAALQPVASDEFLKDLDAKRLLHELQVHQIELEMQNEELQRSTLARELLLEEYTALYDFAPVGYLSLDRDGQILKTNLAGAALVGLARSRLSRQPFTRFVAREDRHLFTALLQRVFRELSGKTTCELRLLREGRATIFAQLEAQASGSGLECLVAIIDVSDLRSEERKVRIAADQLAQSFDELKMLSAELNLSEERERRRIALALHDQVVQGLAIGKLNLDSALQKGEIARHPVLQELLGTLEASMLELRDLSRDLSPPILYDLGLRAAIASMGEHLGGKYGFRFVLHSDCPPEAILSQNLAISIFQFFRELLMNIVKHARSATVTVMLRQSVDRLELSIADDGIGFDANHYQEGFGLASIRQRVHYLRGDFKIESGSGTGTRSEISIDTGCSEKLKKGEGRWR